MNVRQLWNAETHEQREQEEAQAAAEAKKRAEEESEDDLDDLHEVRDGGHGSAMKVGNYSKPQQRLELMKRLAARK